MYLNRFAALVAALIVLAIPAAAVAAKPEGKGKGDNNGGKKIANAEHLASVPAPAGIGANFK